MRNLAKNKKTMFVLNYVGEADLIVDGHRTGTKRVLYTNEKEFKGNVSGATGSTYVDNFGISIDYDKIILISVKLFNELGLNENSVLFIDKKPDYDSNNNPLYDYKVVRIKDSLNEVAILVQKVRNR